MCFAPSYLWDYVNSPFDIENLRFSYFPGRPFSFWAVLFLCDSRNTNAHAQRTFIWILVFDMQNISNRGGRGERFYLDIIISGFLLPIRRDWKFFSLFSVNFQFLLGKNACPVQGRAFSDTSFHSLRKQKDRLDALKRGNLEFPDCRPKLDAQY